MPGSRPCDPFALAIPAASTGNVTGPDWINMNSRGVTVVLDMVTVGTGSVTLTIEGKDDASGKYFTLLAGAAVAANSTNRYTVHPGAVVAANVSANDQLPYKWRILVTANNANPATYTVGGCTLA